MTPEGIIEDFFIKESRRRNAWQCKFLPSITGVPDRILVYAGQVVFVELKAKNGRLSARQKLIHKQLRRHGAKVFVPYSEQDVLKVFEELDSS